jgi:hypothetical protein
VCLSLRLYLGRRLRQRRRRRLRLRLRMRRFRFFSLRLRLGRCLRLGLQTVFEKSVFWCIYCTKISE